MTNPAAMKIARNASKWPPVAAKDCNVKVRPPAAAVSTASSTIAVKSSASSTPKDSSRTRISTFCSSNALATMVVLEIETMAPLKTASIGVQPIARAAAYPSTIIVATCISVTSPAVGASCASRRNLNSSPIAKISRITPRSDTSWMRTWST